MTQSPHESDRARSPSLSGSRKKLLLPLSVIALSAYHVYGLSVRGSVGHYTILIGPAVLCILAAVTAIAGLRPMFKARRATVERVCIVAAMACVVAFYSSRQRMFRLADIGMRRQLGAERIAKLQDWAASTLASEKHQAMLEAASRSSDATALRATLPPDLNAFLGRFRDTNVLAAAGGGYQVWFSTGGWDYHWGLMVGPKGFSPHHPRTYLNQWADGIFCWHLLN